MSERKQTGQISITLLSQMLGASLLSISFIIAKLGWVISLIAIAFTVIFDIYMYKFFVNMSHYTQARSYRELTEKAVSKKLSMVLEISIIISYFGIVTAYILISSSLIMMFIKNVIGFDANKYAVKAILSFCVIFPLTLLKSLKQLSKVAAISGVAIFTFALSIIVYFFIHVGSKQLCVPADGSSPIKYNLNAFPNVSPITAFLYFLMYIPSLQGNFTVHTTIPTMVRELQGPPVLRKRVVHISLIIAVILALILYLLVGFMGAAMFGEDIKDNILTAFAPCKWIWVDILSLVYAFVTVISYPLVLYPIKISIVGMCKKDPETKQGYRIQVIVAIVFVSITMALSMVLESIVTIFGFFSALTGVIIYFAVPICLIVQYPKVKKENIHMDHLQAGDVTVDPVLVGVLSMVSPTISDTTIQRVRTLSNKMFGPAVEAPVDANQPQRTLSFLRPRALSISVSEDGVEKIRSNSIVKRNSVSHDLQPAISKHEQATELLAELEAEDVDQNQSIISLIRPQELSISVSDGGVEKIRSNSMIKRKESTSQNENVPIKELITELLEVQAEEASSVTVEQNIVNAGNGIITKFRKASGIIGIVLFTLICGVGVYMNGADVVDQFS
ncbi:Amino_acid transporter family protein [Hexamita inflata]|uniref:Amino acid transporter family protein n=1 Tax=Hexamita inflata TaxID=28002 RepID=A0AA86NMY5_9EUKA|nr:Amino acid transporter family protein [Hexamita inflata]